MTYAKPVTMTVRYYYYDGSATPLSNATSTQTPGTTYTVTAPTISGYTPDKTTYTGTVPTYNFTITIYYTPDGGDDNFPSSLQNMQDMTASICNAVRTPKNTETSVPETTLTDTRDGKSYTIRKLSDGHCWMVQDLNFSLSTSTPLDSSTTDLPDGTSWTPENTTQTETGIKWDSADTSRSYTNSIRTYYNVRAATAGTTDSSITFTNAPGSVCPQGWTLPTGRSTGDYGKLLARYYIKNDLADNNNAAGSAKLRSTPLNFNYTSYYSIGQLSGTTTTRGYYWSSTVYGSDDAYYLYFADDRNLASSSYRGYGQAVRCIAK